MKLRNLLITLGLTLTVGAGVAVATSVKQNEEPKAVEATGETRVYITNNYSCSNLRVYYWGSSDKTVSLKWAYKNTSNEDIYYCDLPSGTTGWQFVGYYGSWYRDTYSLDQSVPSNNTTGWYIYDTSGDGGSKFYMKTWDVTFFTVSFDSNGGTGSMSNQTCFCNANEGNNLNANTFTRYGYTFVKWTTNAGGTGSQYNNQAHINNSTSGATVILYAQWAHASGRYIVGKFGSCNWGIDGAIYLAPQNNQFEGIANFEFGDVFKIVYYNGTELSSYYGYSWILESCGAYQYFSGSGDSDITCNARGTYSFYFRDMEYASGKKISIETSGALTAEHLTVKLMNFAESAGHCGDADRFPAMKTIFLSLTSAEKTIFQGYVSSSTDQFKNAYERYTAWARALGEKPWEEGKVSHALQLSIFNDSSTSSSIIIIAIIASLSILSVGAYFFFKKSKKSEE